MTHYELLSIGLVLLLMVAFIAIAFNTIMNTYNDFIAYIDEVEKDEKECKIL